MSGKSSSGIERTLSKDLSAKWAGKAWENIDEWGQQDLETLLLATQEELGELTQSVLEAQHEDGDPNRTFDELADLAALMYQIQWALEGQQPDADRRYICVDCGEPASLVSLDGGVDHGVECGCERSGGTPVGSYVEVPGPLPEKWSVDTDNQIGDLDE